MEDEYKKYLEIQSARLRHIRERIFRQLLEGKRVWSTEAKKREFIKFLKDTETDLTDKEIRALIKARKEEKNKLVRLLKDYKLITDEDLK